LTEDVDDEREQNERNERNRLVERVTMRHLSVELLRRIAEELITVE
jgi:hypothetical protein